MYTFLNWVHLFYIKTVLELEKQRKHLETESTKVFLSLNLKGQNDENRIGLDKLCLVQNAFEALSWCDNSDSLKIDAY